MKEEVQKYIIELLDYLDQRIPSGGNHSFKLGEEGRLWLWVNFGDKWQSIIFDEEYENISPKETVDDIIITLKEVGYQID